MWKMIGEEENGKWGRSGRGGASGRQKPSLNDGTRAGEPAHTWPDDPSASLCSRCTVTSPRCLCAPGDCPGLPFFYITRCLPVVDMTGDRLWERRPSPTISRCVSHTLVSNASYSSLLMPPINLRMSDCDRGKRETEGDRKGREEGAKVGGIRGELFILQDWQKNSVKCWVGIMLSNIDCDFLGEKQPAFVNLEWLWNNLVPPPHIVECQKRNALQQFIAALYSRALHKPSEMTGQSWNFCCSKCHLSSYFSPSLSYWISFLWRCVSSVCASLWNIKKNQACNIRWFIKN